MNVEDGAVGSSFPNRRRASLTIQRPRKLMASHKSWNKPHGAFRNRKDCLDVPRGCSSQQKSGPMKALLRSTDTSAKEKVIRLQIYGIIE